MSNTKSEIIVRLNSGLGNQLFQLAKGLSVAAKRNARLRYDTTWFRLVSGLHPEKRHLRLPELSVPLPEAFSRPRRLAVGLLATFFDKTRRGKSLLSVAGNMVVVQEDTTTRRDANESVDCSAKRIYLNGYWQTNRPFTRVRNQLLPMIQPKSRLSSGAAALIAKAESAQAGFIHVRRGDYLHYMGEKGALPVTYYSKALAKLREIGKKAANWMIFSEDTEWARTNLSFAPNAEVIDYPSPNRDIEDLMIMKACSAGVIANSSYSWWGAALGDRPDRPIITPDRYWPHTGWIAEGWALPEWTQVRAWD
jgi:hypothetical protein